MVLPEEAWRAPCAPVWHQGLPSPRWICVKRLSGIHLPGFGIRVFLLLRYNRSAVPYSVIFGTISRSRRARDLTPSATRRTRAPTPLYPNAILSPLHWLAYMYRLLVLCRPICIVVELDFHYKDNTWEKSIFLGVRHAPYRKGACPSAPQFFRVPFYLCMHPLTQNYQIWRGNKWEGGLFLGCQSRPHFKLAGFQHSPNF